MATANGTIVDRIMELGKQYSYEMRELLRILIASLNEEEVNMLIDKEKEMRSFNNGFYSLFSWRVQDVRNKWRFLNGLQEKRTQRNASISQLLKWCSDKKSGRVTAAKQQLRDRFLSLSHNDQVAIFRTLLNDCKTDRFWCYGILRKWWSDSIQEDVVAVWEKYHENRCGWVITDFFPEKVVRKYVESLTYPSNYYHLCRRFAGRPWLTIDKARLLECAGTERYLEIMSRMENGITEDEALGLLFKHILTLCEDAIVEFNPVNIYEVDEWFNLWKLTGTEKMIASIYRICKTDAVEELMSFDKSMHKQFSDMYLMEILHIDPSNQKVADLRWPAMYVRYCMENLPERFAKISSREKKGLETIEDTALIQGYELQAAEQDWRYEHAGDASDAAEPQPMKIVDDPEVFEQLKRENKGLSDLAEYLSLEF